MPSNPLGLECLQRRHVIALGLRRLIGIQPSLVHDGLVEEHAHGMDVERNRVPYIAVDSSYPRHLRKVGAFQIKCLGDVVERLDGFAGRHGRHRVKVDDSHVRGLACCDSGREFLVKGRPTAWTAW